MPSELDAGIRQRLTLRFGAAVEPWLDELPDVLAGLAQRWRLEVGAPIPRGTMSAVFHCRLADGRAAVLKASPDRARLAFEAAALGGWRTAHAPAVLALDERLGALLLEAIEPGAPLAATGAYPGVERVAELLTALHGSGVPDPSYPSVGERVAHLFDASTALYERHPELTAVVPPELYERGRRLGARLAANGSPAVLLHGDLTPGNVLDGGAGRGLVAIDPSPCLGDAAFDAVDLLVWLADDVGTIEARAHLLAVASGLDAERLLDWCVAFAAMVALELGSQGGGHTGRAEALLALAARA